MNTNGNAYTVIYTTIVVALVAAILAFVAMTLKPKQDANIKAETISQMLTAAQFYTKDECSAMGNDKVLEAYSQNIKEAYTINLKGESVRDLNTEVKSIELQDGLKAQNKNIKDGSDAADASGLCIQQGWKVCHCRPCLWRWSLGTYLGLHRSGRGSSDNRGRLLRSRQRDSWSRRQDQGRSVFQG